MRAVCCILIALIGASAAVLDGNPCSWCDCTRTGDIITAVVCNCQGEEHKSLVLEQANMKNLTNVKNITVTSCSSVELKSRSFSELTKLETLMIKAAQQVVIAGEVFNTLSRLNLSDVKNLTLGEKSLQNVKNLSTIFMNKTSITKLPQGAIGNLPELAKLRLQNVTLGEIQTGAIQLSMNKEASVLIERSEIGHIQEAGIVCSSIKEFILINSTVKSAAKSSTSIVAQKVVDINGNTLEEDVPSDSFNVTSKSVAVFGNIFKHFPAGLLPDNGETVFFSGNKVLKPNWDQIMAKPLVEKNFINNNFSCKCSSKEKLISMKKSHSWLDNNYCLAKCNLTLNRLPEICQKVSDKDDEICKKFDGTGTAAHTTTTRSPLPTDKPSTSAPRSKSKPTTSSDSGCETILTSSLLSIALSSLIFIIL